MAYQLKISYYELNYFFYSEKDEAKLYLFLGKNKKLPIKFETLAVILKYNKLTTCCRIITAKVRKLFKLHHFAKNFQNLLYGSSVSIFCRNLENI